jgi:hypothetical protein
MALVLIAAALVHSVFYYLPFTIFLTSGMLAIIIFIAWVIGNDIDKYGRK